MTKVVESRKIASALAGVSAVLLGACLSVDSIAQHSPDGGQSMGDGDAAMGDGDTSPGDGDTQPGDGDTGPAKPSACIDRGSYELGAVTVRGLSATCDGKLACINNQCVPLPACVPGITTECDFQPLGTHGPARGFAKVDDYLYWMETGTFDKLHNYQHDGIVMRAQIGEWQPQEILHGLDLEDQETAESWSGWYLFSGGIAGKSSLWAVSSHGAGPFSIDDARDSPCVSASGSAYWVYNFDAYIQDLMGGTQEKVRSGIINASCASVDDAYVWFGQSLVNTTTPYAARISTASPHKADVMGPLPGDMIGQQDDTVFTAPRNTGYIKSAKFTEGQGSWSNIAPVFHLAGQPVVSGDHVYWGQYGGSRKSALTMRVPLSGSATPEVLAEIPEQVGVAGGALPNASLFVTSKGFGWAYSSAGHVHFVPRTGL